MSDEPKPRKPRRRRRRGRGNAGNDASTGSGASKSEGGGGSSESAAERTGTRRRAGRKPARGDDRPAGGEGRSGRRRRRRRGPRSEGADDQPQASAASRAASLDDVDAGWDAPAEASHTAAAKRPDLGPVPGGEPAVDEREPWGDDGDAPTPDVQLDADLPANPPGDDPDPATAYLIGDVDGGASTAPPDSRDDAHAHADIDASAVRDVVGIKFSSAGRIHEYDANGAHLTVGAEVVVEAERGTRVGTVALAAVRRPHRTGKLKRVLRPANRQDQLILDDNRERAAQALDMAREAARKKRVNAKIFRAELSFGGTKLVVYYSSEDRVDLRDVQNQLSRKLDYRVELRQVGVRDAAKLIGGIGSCGRELCCSTFLPAFAPVSIKMAKDQNMVLNPSKVSGQCGRLKCCLVYEQETYASMRKGLPRMGKRVITDDGEGRVVEVNVLRQRIRVSLGHGEFRVYAADQVTRKFPPQQQKKQQEEPSTDAGQSEPGEQS